MVCEGTEGLRGNPKNRRNKLKDSGFTSDEVDFISANNLANGNIRLTNMLRSGDA